MTSKENTPEEDAEEPNVNRQLTPEEEGRLRYELAVENSHQSPFYLHVRKPAKHLRDAIVGIISDFSTLGIRLFSNAGVVAVLLWNDARGLLQEIRGLPMTLKEMWFSGNFFIPFRNLQGFLKQFHIVGKDLRKDLNISLENARLLYNSAWSNQCKIYVGGITLLSMYTVYNYIMRPWPRHKHKTELPCLYKTVVITGASSGIGYRLAYEFAKRGAFVVLASPDMVKARKTRLDLSRKLLNSTKERKEQALDNAHVRYYDQLEIPDNLNIDFLLQNMVEVDLNLSCTSSIYSFTRKVQGMFPDGIDILINNAAINAPPEQMVVTDEGKEVHFAVNYYGHFVLTNLLLGLLAKRQGARIINITCKAAAESGYINMEEFMNPYLQEDGLPFLPATHGYANSKLAMYLFNRQLSKEMQLSGIKNVTTYAVCPGKARTFLNRYTRLPFFRYHCHNILSKFYKKDWHAAQTVLHCALSPTCAGESGFFYENNKRSVLRTKHKRDQDLIADALWKASKTLMGVGHNSMLKLTEQMHMISHQNIFQLANNLFLHRRDVTTHLLLMEEKHAFKTRHRKVMDETGDARSDFTYFWHGFYLSGGVQSGLIERWVLYNTHPSFRELQKEYDVWFECTGSSHYHPKNNGKMASLQFMESMPQPLLQKDIECLEELYASDSEPDEETESKPRYYEDYIAMEQFI